MDHALARQVFRQRAARRLAARERLHHHLLFGRRRRHLGLRRNLLQLEQPQLELVEQRTTLGRLAEPFVPQLGDDVLQLLDHQRPFARIGLRRQTRRPLGEQHRFQRLDMVGQRFIGV